jgi:hypothetical protein
MTFKEIIERLKAIADSLDAAAVPDAIRCDVEDLIEDILEPEDDGQPDERQEWFDFDPDC